MPKDQPKPDSPEDREQYLINRRRQAYWARRRTVQAMFREGSYLLTPRMTHAQLWDALGAQLHSMLLEEADGSNPDRARAVLDAWELYAAIRERGVQLTLI